jgi:hypothetical protein
MKTLFKVIVLTYAYMGTVMAAEPIPSLNQTRQIDLLTADSGWILRIRPDGSAHLQFGSLMEDGARCPAGTFAFSDVYAFLVPKIKENNSAGDVAVAIVPETATSVTCQYINEFEAKPFFLKAQQTCMPIWDKVRFDELVHKYPIESEFSLSKPAEPGALQPKALSQETPTPKPQPEVQPTKSTKATVTSATTIIAKDTATEAPTAITPWNIIIVLFLASLGLLWWILKRRR